MLEFAGTISGRMNRLLPGTAKLSTFIVLGKALFLAQMPFSAAILPDSTAVSSAA
jgi:hypothetical protein